MENPIAAHNTVSRITKGIRVLQTQSGIGAPLSSIAKVVAHSNIAEKAPRRETAQGFVFLNNPELPCLAVGKGYFYNRIYIPAHCIKDEIIFDLNNTHTLLASKEVLKAAIYRYLSVLLICQS